MKKNYLILVIICFTINCFSQEYYHGKGYIISNKNDTIKGSFKKKSNLEKRIIFNRKGNNTYLSYRPNQIKGYFIEGKGSFKSMNIKGNELYVKCMVEGKICLYKFDNKFYLKDDKNFYELIYDKGIIDKRTPTHDYRYKKILRHVLNNKSLLNKIMKCSYADKDMVDLVSTYNRISGTKNKIFESSYKTSIKFGLKAGFKMMIVNYPNYASDFKGYIFKRKSTPYFGVYLNFSRNGKLSFQQEFIIAKRQNLGTLDFPSMKKYSSLNNTIIQCPTSIQYSFLTSKLNPYFIAGVVWGYTIKKSNFLYIIDDINPGIEKEKRELELARFEIGFKTGIGISYPINNGDLIKLECSYEKSYTGFNWVVNYFDYCSFDISISYNF